MEKPLVSIIIPVYNGANFVSQAIESALNQDYSNCEILVINDGSSDDGATRKAIGPYLDRVRYFEKNNGGVSSALNLGISKMRGQYFSWLSHDDLYEVNKISREIELISKTKADVCLCPSQLIAWNRKILHSKKVRVQGVFSGNQILHKKIQGYSLNGLGFLVPKRLIDQTGFFDESLRYFQDIDYWIRLFANNINVVCTSERLTSTRIHDKQQTVMIADKEEDDFELLFLKSLSDINCNSKEQYDRNFYLLEYFAQGAISWNQITKYYEILKASSYNKSSNFLILILIRCKSLIKKRLRKLVLYYRYHKFSLC